MWANSGGVTCVGGPAFVMWVQPTEEELFKRYNPDLQKKSLERRYERQKEFDDFVVQLKEHAKSDKHSTSLFILHLWPSFNPFFLPLLPPLPPLLSSHVPISLSLSLSLFEILKGRARERRGKGHKDDGGLTGGGRGVVGCKTVWTVQEEAARGYKEARAQEDSNKADEAKARREAMRKEAGLPSAS